MDIEPKGQMILFTNSDVPGVIGSVGKILGDNGINISDFRLGRKKDEALAVIIVDNNVSKDIIAKLEALEAAKTVCFVKI
jgi:D-3-phosphoglycerate dehydrogenase